MKETSKLGPRPEKPIEIYEYERYSIVGIFTFGVLPSVFLFLAIVYYFPMPFMVKKRLTACVVFSTYGLPWTMCKLQLSFLSKGNITPEYHPFCMY